MQDEGDRVLHWLYLPTTAIGRLPSLPAIATSAFCTSPESALMPMRIGAYTGTMTARFLAPCSFARSAIPAMQAGAPPCARQGG
jgi:hypothetical protein